MFLVVMVFLATGEYTYSFVPDFFGGDPRPWGRFIEEFFKHLYITFYHRISGISLQAFTDRLPVYQQAIWERITNFATVGECRIDAGIANIRVSHYSMPVQFQRVVGVLDDTDDDFFRPGDEPRRRGEINYDVQRAFYSGYFKEHGLKAQTVMFPDGIVGSAFVASIRIDVSSQSRGQGSCETVFHVALPVKNSKPANRS